MKDGGKEIGKIERRFELIIKACNLQLHLKVTLYETPLHIAFFKEIVKKTTTKANNYSLRPKMIVLPLGVLCLKLFIQQTFWDRKL
jgi:hypothetical protein